MLPDSTGFGLIYSEKLYDPWGIFRSWDSSNKKNVQHERIFVSSKWRTLLLESFSSEVVCNLQRHDKTDASQKHTLLKHNKNLLHDGFKRESCTIWKSFVWSRQTNFISLSSQSKVVCNLYNQDRLTSFWHAWNSGHTCSSCVRFRYLDKILVHFLVREI